MSHWIIEKEVKDSFKVSVLRDAAADGLSRISTTCHRIFLLTEATGTIHIDQTGYPVYGQEVFLVAKGQLFAFHPGTRLNGFELLFGDCFWERTPASASNCKAALFDKVALNQRLPLKEADSSSLLPVCDLLLQEYQAADYQNKPDAMAAYLKIIMIKLANILALPQRVANDADHTLYQRFLELVALQYRHTREVGDFAALLSVSARKLSELCRHQCGLGAKELINAHVIAEAKRHLQFSEKPVKEIAYDLSFSTPEQFSHFFKKNTRVSPADFRSFFVNIGR